LGGFSAAIRHELIGRPRSLTALTDNGEPGSIA